MNGNTKLKGTLSAPPIAENIPSNSQWLSGEGAGSWFYIESANDAYQISRYSPSGKIECSGLFRVTNQIDLNLEIDFEFVHLSHCKSITIQQQGKVVKLERININYAFNPANTKSNS